MMSVRGTIVGVCFGCLCGIVTKAFVAFPSRYTPGQHHGRERRASTGLRIIPGEKGWYVGQSLDLQVGHFRWGYVTEEIDAFPEYIPNMNVSGVSKPGASSDNAPASELDLDFVHGGVHELPFHDPPVECRAEAVDIPSFIEAQGLALLPSEAEMMEERRVRARRRSSKAREDRYDDGAEEDLVDDTLDDVPMDARGGLGRKDAVVRDDYDDSDSYDDGYDTSGDDPVMSDDLDGSSLF